MRPADLKFGSRPPRQNAPLVASDTIISARFRPSSPPQPRREQAGARRERGIGVTAAADGMQGMRAAGETRGRATAPFPTAGEPRLLVHYHHTARPPSLRPLGPCVAPPQPRCAP